MELTMKMRRSIVDAALEALMEKRIRRGKPMAPAEDCEFPEETPQEFPEDEIQEFPEYTPDEEYEEGA